RLEAPGAASSETIAAEPLQASAEVPVTPAAEPKKAEGKKKGAKKHWILESEASNIEDRLSKLEAAAAAAETKTAAAAPAAPAAGAAPAATADAKVELNSLRPVFKSADGKNELALRATVQFDAANYFQDTGDMGAAVPADAQDLGSGALFR